MSVETELNNIQYSGNNSTSIAYCVPFYFFEDKDLKVVVTDQAGTDTLLLHPNDYTVSGEGNIHGGSITTTAPWPSTFKVTTYREIRATQTTVYEENANFPAKSEERALDKLTMLVQQLARKLNQTFRIRESDGKIAESGKIPNSVLGIGADGAPIFRTADEVASFLNLSQQFFDRPTKTFLNQSERSLAVPEFVGQLGSQRDNTSIWIATGTTAGSWAAYSAGTGGVTLSMLAEGILANSIAGRAKMEDGFLSANASGRAKMADAYLTLAKLATGIFTADAAGRGKFASGFVDPSLTQAGLWNAIAPPGAVLQTVYAEYTANSDMSVIIPNDDSPPQITEGTLVLSGSITPSTPASKIKIFFHGSVAGNATYNSAAVFRNSITSAIAASMDDTSNGAIKPIIIDYLDAPASTSVQTYTIRVGPHAGVIRMNGSYIGRYLGGAMRATLTLQEIKV